MERLFETVSDQDKSEAVEKKFKVPQRKTPKPVIRKVHSLRAEPLSPSTLLTPLERLRRGAARARVELYKHADLPNDHVRLLMVNAGEPDDAVVVSLQAVPISDLKREWEYEALSYHWGTGDAERPVFIRDISDNSPVKKTDEAVLLGKKRLHVRSNLHEALSSLRRSDGQVVLWVDAICINQENEKEKKIQVAKMAQIYSMAERVCIWLGASDERSDNAIKFISDMLDLELLPSLIRDERYASQWNDLVDLMKRSWFSRRWVIQEIALARDATVHCGQAEINWADFRDAVGLFVMNFDTIRELFKLSAEFRHNYFAIGELEPLGAKVLIDTVSNVFRKNADGTNFEPALGLEYLVSRLATFESSDPRDAVNALRNIAKEIPWATSGRYPTGTKLPPRLDYSKDLLEVYIDFVKWVIEGSGSIDIICRHWALPERKEQTYNYPELVKLPSWLQEISESSFAKQEEGYDGRQDGDSLVGLPGERWYNASHGRLAHVVKFGDYERPAAVYTRRPSQANSQFSVPVSEAIPEKIRDPSLYVQGLSIGIVTWAAGPIAEGVIPKLCLQKGGWTERRAQQVDKAPEKLWRTLVADRGPDGKNPPGWYHRACLHCLVNDTPNGNINTRELLSKGQPDIVRDYLKRVQAVTWNRVFLEADSVTQGIDPLFGLGPPETKTGDLLCILLGCSVPCILRKHPHIEDAFFFIGEAYIYGMMDGEAVSSQEIMPTRDFRLL